MTIQLVHVIFDSGVELPRERITLALLGSFKDGIPRLTSWRKRLKAMGSSRLIRLQAALFTALVWLVRAGLIRAVKEGVPGGLGSEYSVRYLRG